MSLNSPWFELVISGKKRYEGRRLTEKMKSINLNDIIIFSHYADPSKEQFKAKVTSIQIFPTFEIALSNLPINEVLPIEDITLEKGIDIYKKYVSINTQNKDGVCMIGIKLINDI